jgi:hypothetical protein
MDNCTTLCHKIRTEAQFDLSMLDNSRFQ